MRTVLAIGLVFGGCVVEHHQDPVVDPPLPVQPRTCMADITLDGSAGSSTPTTVGPLVLDTNGVSVCLHLDATHNLVAAHFAAETNRETGTTSSFATLLEDATLAPIQAGWDVTFGGSPPTTFENLEWNAPLHQMTDAVLWIHAQNGANGSVTSRVDLSLFEPLE